jgi:hypothetical protein
LDRQNIYTHATIDENHLQNASNDIKKSTHLSTNEGDVYFGALIERFEGGANKKK